LYTDIVLDNLFDITTETYLVVEIEKILEELKMISSVTSQQGIVMNDLFKLVSQSGKRTDTTAQYFSSTTQLEYLKDLEGYIRELSKLAESTHAAVRTPATISGF
jgi:hypothetical protein